MVRLLFATLIFFYANSAAYAQGPFPIEVVASNPDIVGSRLVLKLRERIASSPIFATVGSGDYPRWVLTIQTFDPDDNLSKSGIRTAFSANILIQTKGRFAWYLTNLTGVCGTLYLALDQCSENILAQVSDTINNIPLSPEK